MMLTDHQLLTSHSFQAMDALMASPPDIPIPPPPDSNATPPVPGGAWPQPVPVPLAPPPLEPAGSADLACVPYEGGAEAYDEGVAHARPDDEQSSECSWGSNESATPRMGLRRRRGGSDDDEETDGLGGVEYYESDGRGSVEDEGVGGAPEEEASEVEGLALIMTGANSKRSLASLTPAMLAAQVASGRLLGSHPLPSDTCIPYSHFLTSFLQGQAEMSTGVDEDACTDFGDEDGAGSIMGVTLPRVAEERSGLSLIGRDLPGELEARLWASEAAGGALSTAAPVDGAPLATGIGIGGTDTGTGGSHATAVVRLEGRAPPPMVGLAQAGQGVTDAPVSLLQHGEEPTCAGVVHAELPMCAATEAMAAAVFAASAADGSPSAREALLSADLDAKTTELAEARRELVEVHAKMASMEGLLGAFQQRDDKKAAELSKQLSMNRVNNEAAFAALRQRITHAEEDLDELHAASHDADGPKQLTGELLSEADGASSRLDDLLAKLGERLAAISAAEVTQHAQTHATCERALASLARAMHDGIVEYHSAPGGSGAGRTAVVRLHRMDGRVRSWLSKVRAALKEVGTDPGAEPPPPPPLPRDEPPPPKGATRDGGAGKGVAKESSAALRAEPIRGKGKGSAAPANAEGRAATDSKRTELEAEIAEIAALKAENAALRAVPAKTSRARGGVGEIAGGPTGAGDNRTTDVALYKADKDTRLGVTLTGAGHPSVESISVGGAAHGVLVEGDQIISINGWQAIGHSETTKRLKRLTGSIKLKVARAADG